MPLRRHAAALLLAGSVAVAGPALAHPLPPMNPAEAPPPPMAAPNGQPHPDVAAWERARMDWLAECRSRHGNGNMVGGAVVGGVVGGLLGNAVAGRGDKTLGTVAGAVAGAAAGGAIGHGADQRRVRDYCETYLERHMAYGQPGHGYAGQGYPAYSHGYAYQPMTVMVPVMMVPAAVQTAPAPPRECKETQVIEEWVPVAAPARRLIPRRAVPDKRIKVN